MRALLRNALDDARIALVTEPDSATTVFFDHEWEPPLCTATRLQCSLEIIELLLEHGADINAEDMHGRTAVTILCAMAQRHNEAGDASPFSSFHSGYPFADTWDETRRAHKEWLTSMQDKLIRHGAEGASGMSLGMTHVCSNSDCWIPDALPWLATKQFSILPVLGHTQFMTTAAGYFVQF